MSRPTPHRRRPVAAVLSALVSAALVVTLGACAGSSASGDAASEPAGPVPTAGEELRLVLSRQLTSVNPHKGGSPDSQGAVVGSVYEALTRITPDSEVAPSLATEWEQVSDLEWRFTIRTDAVFSDGTPLTAETIVWNFQQLLDPEYKGTTGAPLRKFVASVESPDPTTILFHLSAPALDLPGRLWNAYIVDPTFAQSHNIDTESLGSGPYQIDTLDLENGATLSPNPHWAGDEPDFAKVRYTVLASEAQRVAAIQAGEADIVLNVEPLSLDQFADSSVYETTLGVGPQPLVLAVNEEKAGTPLADERVRQALNYATDKETIIEGLFKGAVEPLPGTVLFEPYQEEAPGVEAYPYDPDKAKELLAEAGYADGFTLEVDVPSGTYVSADLASQAIAAQWKEVGVDLTITQTPFPTWLDRQYGDAQKGADLVYIMWGGQYRGGFQLFDPFTSDHIQSDVVAPEFDDLVRRAQAATDLDEQRDLVVEAAELYREQAHTIFLYPSPFTAVVSRAVTWELRPSRYLYAQEVGRA
ncbi:ABC transporter substrate-binding protein [Cellulomonas algicola]|uniref:ABC transporter substrate-binding protein n=1 Tax=Cellulomonas algicola TaxID=2071633 RepID=A0A401V2D3_9CELL|nr:ABC transporter substrate-binding protein [Cellulomonas algicola]GCD21078.1 ABC transporter substrate-binding protein [Cellulomonas algicola]